MMKWLIRPFQWLYCIYALLLFVVLMIPIFIWALVVINFGRMKGGHLVYEGCKVWADVWLFLIFIRHRNVYLEPLQKGQSYIFVANHISYLDAALIPKTIRTPVRALGKAEMAKIPIFGFIYKYAIVTVDRTSSENRTKSVLLLKSIIRKGVSVMVFPEGTFNETNKPLKDFYDGAFRIAIETGTPVKPIVILDSYNRLHYKSIFSLNPGRSRAVFLPAIEVTDLTMNDLPALKMEVYSTMETALREYNASWIESKRTDEHYI